MARQFVTRGIYILSDGSDSSQFLSCTAHSYPQREDKQSCRWSFAFFQRSLHDEFLTCHALGFMNRTAHNSSCVSVFVSPGKMRTKAVAVCIHFPRIACLLVPINLSDLSEQNSLPQGTKWMPARRNWHFISIQRRIEHHPDITRLGPPPCL